MPKKVGPYTVPQRVGGASRIFVTNNTTGVPPEVMAYLLSSPRHVVLRVAGGCSGMSPEESLGMLKYLTGGLSFFRGVVSSGGTRSISDGMIDPMVTEVPGALVAQNPETVRSVCTVPRTGQLGLVDESRLVLDVDSGTSPNPGVNFNVIVQSSGGEPLGWDGDLSAYFSAYATLVNYSGWRAGLIAYNGGGVTAKEIRWAISLDWPVILVEGSGRVTDAIIKELKEGTFRDKDGNPATRIAKIFIVPNNDVAALQQAMRNTGLIVA